MRPWTCWKGRKKRLISQGDLEIKSVCVVKLEYHLRDTNADNAFPWTKEMGIRTIGWKSLAG